MSKDLKKIRPYGDHLDDGRIQLSFTLPIPANDIAREAARLYLEKLGMVHAEVTWMESMGEEFSFFVAYGYATPHIDVTKIKVPRLEFPLLSFHELVEKAHEKIKRKIVVVGATTGSDAHTVGLDAILSMKGIKGDKGLEYYPIFRVVNLRAQVSNELLVQKAAELRADAILVSQVVTQQDQHLTNLKDLLHKMRGEKKLPSHLLKIVGGPRMDHKTARSLGFDAGFGPLSKPSEVANYIVDEMVRRFGHETTHRVFHSETSPGKRSFFSWFNSRS